MTSLDKQPREAVLGGNVAVLKIMLIHDVIQQNMSYSFRPIFTTVTKYITVVQ